jgi:hypothetical protein
MKTKIRKRLEKAHSEAHLSLSTISSPLFGIKTPKGEKCKATQRSWKETMEWKPLNLNEMSEEDGAA